MVSPRIEQLGSDGALWVRVADGGGSVITSAFASIDPANVDRVNLQMCTNYGSAHFMVTPDEAIAIARMIERQAEAVRDRAKVAA